MNDFQTKWFVSETNGFTSALLIHMIIYAVKRIHARTQSHPLAQQKPFTLILIDKHVTTVFDADT